MKKILCLVLSLAMMTTFTACDKGEGQTQEESKYPTRTVNILVGNNPGGAMDLSARTYAKFLEKETGATFVVTNVAGAGGSLATNQLNESEADGYTLLLMNDDLIMNNLTGTSDIAISDLDPVCSAITSRTVAMFSNSEKFKTLDELIAYAKENPGKLKGAAQTGTSIMDATLAVTECTGIDVNIVDVGGVSDRVANLAGGHIDFMICPYSAVKDYVTSGKFTPLVFFNPERLDAYKDYPVASEYGIDYTFERFFALFAPKGTPVESLKTLSDAVGRMSKDPDFIKEVEDSTNSVEYISNDDIGKYMSDTEQFVKNLHTKYGK